MEYLFNESIWWIAFIKTLCSLEVLIILASMYDIFFSILLECRYQDRSPEMILFRLMVISHGIMVYNFLQIRESLKKSS